MYSEDDFFYAIESTEVIREPDRRIDTFGSTSFEFHLVSELMDSVGQVRVREGRIEAERPRILTPNPNQEVGFEGFTDQAEAFMGFLQSKGFDVKGLVQYGFSFRKNDVKESVVHDPFEDVCKRVAERVESSGNPLAAVIKGVDDTWEICLLKFTLEMVKQSSGTNLFDFKRRGLL